MSSKNTNFIFATVTLIGAIVGLGMFGIPYTAVRAGFFVGVAYIVVLGVAVLLIHLMYGEVVERTKEPHRFIGYAEKYLGKKWKTGVGVLFIFSVYATLLPYIIVGGEFLSVLYFGVTNDKVSYGLSVAFWLVMSVGVWRGIRTVAKVELAMTGLLALLAFGLFVFGVEKIRFENFSVLHTGDIFLPYGVVLFALSGMFAIPEIQKLLKRDGKQYRNAILWGSVAPIFLYILFTALVVGVSGEETSEEAIGGLAKYLGSGVARAGALFGLLAIATSYLVVGSNLKHTFEYDWHVRPWVSGALVTVVPIALFAAGLQQFIAIIAFSGAVLGAVMAVLLVLMYQRATARGEKKPGYALRLPKLLQWGLAALFALGGIYEIIEMVMRFYARNHYI